MEAISLAENNIRDQINKYNLKLKSHYFNYKQSNNQIELLDYKAFDDSELYKFCKSNINDSKMLYIYNRINAHNNLEKNIKLSSFNCRHLFHDETWLKCTPKTFFYEVDDVPPEFYCNTISMTDIKAEEFSNFTRQIEMCGYKIKHLKFEDEDDDDESYSNTSLIWVIIYI